MLSNNAFLENSLKGEGSGVGGRRPGAGRPKLGPTSKMRSMRLTDDEYDFVRWAVKQYRNEVESIDVRLFKQKM